MGRFALVMAVTTGAGIVTALGVWSVYYRQDWAIRNSTYFMSFAAGILVALPFLRLIPASTSELESAPLFLLGGFLLMLGSRRVFHLYHADEETDEAEHALIGIIPLAGIAFHSFIDGIVHAIAFTFSILTGAVLRPAWSCTSFRRESSHSSSYGRVDTLGKRPRPTQSSGREFRHPWALSSRTLSSVP